MLHPSLGVSRQPQSRKNLLRLHVLLRNPCLAGFGAPLSGALQKFRVKSDVRALREAGDGRELGTAREQSTTGAPSGISGLSSREKTAVIACVLSARGKCFRMRSLCLPIHSCSEVNKCDCLILQVCYSGFSIVTIPSETADDGELRQR